MNSNRLIHCCLLVLLYVLSGCNEKKDNNKKAPANTLFVSLSPSQTNIDFQNTLTEGLNINILMYEYFYNGGGVAAGDFNKDGLVDLYFTANMSDNKLYLNKGNMKFEDITSICGDAGRPGPWKTDLRLAGTNADGKSHS